jgi:hypothetical protein
MEFKKLEIKQEGNWLKRLVNSKQFKKSVLFIVIGAIAGLLYTFFTEGKELSQLASEEIYRNMFTGAFLGFFITNSPCAKGKC